MSNSRPKEQTPRLRFNTDGSISVVSWGCADNKRVLVELPTQKGRYIWCDPCVLVVACPNCEAEIGEPCKRQHTADGYGSSEHYLRKDAYTGLKNSGVVCSHRAWVET